MLTPARQRPIRAIVAILTLVALLSLPLSAFGAKGGLTAKIDALTKVVSPGGSIAVRASFANGGSPLTHFEFNGGVPAGSGVTLTSVDEPCSGLGTTSSRCVFGTLGANETKSLLFVFAVPATSASATIVFSGAFSADSTSKGKPSSSQRQEWGGQAPIQINASGEAFGTWHSTGSPTFGPFGLTQQTTVHGPAGSGYVVLLQHTGDEFCGTGTGWGQTVDMDVAGGEGAITVEILFARQPGLTPTTLRVVWDDDCNDVPKTAGCSAALAPCLITEWAPGVSPPQVKATVYLPHNGRLKGW